MSEKVQVTIAQGTLEGRKYTSNVTGQVYCGFKGIPYAKPPIGPLRFRPPAPPDSWKGVRDASMEGSNFAQYFSAIDKYLGDEDGLYLNVYTKTLLPEVLQPVMVFIHPGSFYLGSGHSLIYGPDFLLTEDVVLVVPNFRLGALGFLNVEGTDATTNNGLRDQNAALKWVRDNITKFGGDPNNVTLFGSSSGASLVHFQMLAPDSEGLFHRAIAQSGTVLYPVCNISKRDALSRAFRLGKALGYNASDPQSLVDYLRSVPVKDLVLAQDRILTEEESVHIAAGIHFAPCEETPGKNAFIPGSPEQLLKAGKFHQIPLIMGATDADGKVSLQFILNNPRLHKVNEHYEAIFNYNWKNALKIHKLKAAAEEIKKVYFGDEAVCDKTIEKYVNLQTDLFFHYPFYKSLECHRKHSKHPVYVYKFTKKEPDNYVLPSMHAKSSKLPGATHGADILHLFHSTVNPIKMPKGSPGEKSMKNIVKLWTNFAKTGNPSESLDVNWPPVTAEGNIPYINISENLKVEDDFDFSGVKLLEEIINKHMI